MKCDQVDQGELVTSYHSVEKISYKDKQVQLWIQKSIVLYSCLISNRNLSNWILGITIHETLHQSCWIMCIIVIDLSIMNLIESLN